MELRNLITFIHVAEPGSFTKAAQQLGYRKDYIIAKETPLSMYFVTNTASKFALAMKDIACEPFILTEYGQG